MFTLTFTKNCNRSLSIKNVGKDQPIMMASSTLMSVHMVANIVLNIDLEGERFCYQCYIRIYGLSKHLGGGVEKLYSFPAKSSNFFFQWKVYSCETSFSLWQFWLHLLLDLSTIFFFMFWVSLLHHKKRLDVLSTHRLSPSKGYESDPTLFSIVSNSFHPSPHLESLSKSLFSHFNNIFQERDTLTGVQSVSLIKWSQKL